MSDYQTTSLKADVYERVTSQIVNAIEAGVGNWRMPWHTSGRFAFSPISVVSKKPYRGVNTVCLWAAAQAKGYEGGDWATYQQWQGQGAQVRRGEKATLVVFWKFANSRAESQEDGEEQTVSTSRLLFIRGYSVFNAAQVDGFKPKGDVDTPIEQRIERAEEFFGRIPAALYTTATEHSTLRPMTQLRCRPFPRSSRLPITTRPGHMKPAIGQPRPADATGNWENDSAIMPMPLRNWWPN